MFNIFKRSAPAPSKSAPQAKASAQPAGGSSHKQSALSRNAAILPPLTDEPPLPEVVEGNEHTDWALWEDSVIVLDSQMQGLTPSARIYEREKQTPSEFQDLDPFARVNKKSG